MRSCRTLHGLFGPAGCGCAETVLKRSPNDPKQPESSGVNGTSQPITATGLVDETCDAAGGCEEAWPSLPPSPHCEVAECRECFTVKHFRLLFCPARGPLVHIWCSTGSRKGSRRWRRKRSDERVARPRHDGCERLGREFIFPYNSFVSCFTVMIIAKSRSRLICSNRWRWLGFSALDWALRPEPHSARLDYAIASSTSQRDFSQPSGRLQGACDCRKNGR